MFTRQGFLTAALLLHILASCSNQATTAFVPSPMRPLRISSDRRSSGMGAISSSSASSFRQNKNERYYTFDEMKSMEVRLGNLVKEAPELLCGFYEPHLKSFSVRPGSVTSISVTSTCFALQTIQSTGDCSIFSSAIDLNMKAHPPNIMKNTNATADTISRRIPLRSVVKALLRANWRKEDMFQVPLLLETVLKMDGERDVLNGDMDEELCHQVKELISATLESRPKRRNGLNQFYSDYIQYLITEALTTLVESTPKISNNNSDVSNANSNQQVGLGGLPPSALPAEAASLTLLSLTRCVEISYNELCRQLAFRTAGDMTNFDVIRLAYSLLTYVKASHAMVGTAGREVRTGEGPEPGTAVGLPNRRLIRAALGVFFEEQHLDGTWDKGQPIYKSFRKVGRDVGNAFVFAADTVGSLLGSLPAEDFRPHLEELNRLLGWFEQHQTVEFISDYCDPNTNQCYGKPLRGWASPHLTTQATPLAWSTAQVLSCTMRMRKVVQRLLHVDVLEEFGGVTNKGVPNLASWDRLLDTDLGDPAKDHRAYRTLKDVLEERMIQPFLKIDERCNLPQFGAAYSSILFGPPGTAKSTICEALAQRLGWDFVVIDTASFLADGLTNVASRIRYVFARLQSLNDCVILFDEIEEFCLDRESPGLGMESRMLTTAMLTAINDLRRAKKSIFFLATNRLRAFDSAIIRPGRFDMQLFVGTPNLEARVILLRNQLASVPVEPSTKDAAVMAFRSFLSSVWNEDIMFFNYLEALQFASACASIVAKGNVLTEEAMAAILKSQAIVMTVRGSVREEYLSSMGLSRF
ncbi:hypothetical protein HJC23_000002 [Cyclotella cryptica]|uniref:AAA+ ATPase domain-containing protein n=1 Tax=Cyclotella cryptica TaxID=29204 RepID=A0ABD3P377_9STRA|eukprot:CCRYP_017988-RA/>CCRYP_017988-RA protein AED:0.08 eAED:0.08 QI:528/1/1/1/1/1/8/1213/808